MERPLLDGARYIPVVVAIVVVVVVANVLGEDIEDVDMADNEVVNDDVDDDNDDNDEDVSLGTVVEGGLLLFLLSFLNCEAATFAIDIEK